MVIPQVVPGEDIPLKLRDFCFYFQLRMKKEFFLLVLPSEDEIYVIKCRKIKLQFLLILNREISENSVLSPIFVTGMLR